MKFDHPRPYHPQTCGRVERFHQTQKGLAAQPPAATLVELQHQLDRFRRDRVDPGGVITVRYVSRLRHIGLGREPRGKRVLALIADTYIRVDAETGELLRELHLDPTKDYQPLGRPPGPRPPRKQPSAPPATGVKTGRRPPAGPRP